MRYMPVLPYELTGGIEKIVLRLVRIRTYDLYDEREPRLKCFCQEDFLAIESYAVDLALCTAPEGDLSQPRTLTITGRSFILVRRQAVRR